MVQKVQDLNLHWTSQWQKKFSFNPAVNESGKVKESERRGMASLSYTKPEIWKTSNTHCPNGH